MKNIWQVRTHPLSGVRIDCDNDIAFVMNGYRPEGSTEGQANHHADAQFRGGGENFPLTGGQHGTEICSFLDEDRVARVKNC